MEVIEVKDHIEPQSELLLLRSDESRPGILRGKNKKEEEEYDKVAQITHYLNKLYHDHSASTLILWHQVQVLIL